jgi:phage terminase large subunit-like protein
MLQTHKDGMYWKVEDYLNNNNYSLDNKYVPSEFALEFVTFIKLVNGSEGEENKTPVMHYRMLDTIVSGNKRVANLCFRGSGKTTVGAEYFFLYLATYGDLPGFGKVNLALYVSDSIDNGVKNMRKNLEHRWNNSDFLKKYIPRVSFTDIRWEFENADGKTFVVKGYGATTGVRGAKELGTRPQLAVLDDLISDQDARSPTVTAAIEDTVHKAVNYALHPTKNMIIWSGTPFNAKDPLYKAVESGAWDVNVYPVCESFPCDKADFKSAWPDRFTYDYVKGQYENALKSGKVDTFNQELMLRIMSDDDRMVQDGDIGWYKIDAVLRHKQRFNFYITTDFATSVAEKSDFSVISVWAYNNVGDWLWVDGICKRQLMDKNIDDLFRLAQLYKPQSVGVEVTGQQGGFVTWIMDQMMTRNIYFPLASEANNNKPGIRPNTNKMVRFNTVLPLFKARKIFFPVERKNEPTIAEAISELSLAAVSGFKSKHDDFLDTISMLSVLKPWKPSEEAQLANKTGDMWELDVEDSFIDRRSSYII